MVRVVAHSSPLRFYCCFTKFWYKNSPSPVLSFASSFHVLFFLQSASHIAASPKVSGKVKKDNVKYAAWAATQINRAYKVSYKYTLMLCFYNFSHDFSFLVSLFYWIFPPTSLPSTRHWKPPIRLVSYVAAFMENSHTQYSEILKSPLFA